MPSLNTPNTYALTQRAELPAAAPAGCSNEFAVALAGCGFLAWRNEVEPTRHVQPALFSRRIGLARANGLGGFTTHGTDLTTSGTLTAGALSTASGVAASTRTRMTSASAIGSSARVRTSAAHVVRPTNSPGYNVGGFFFHARISHGALVTNQRGFVGLYGTVADIGNVEPNALVNMVGFAYVSGTVNLGVFVNDGTGTATATGFGSTYPLANNVYDLFLYAGTDANKIEYLAYRLQTGDITSGSLTTNLPDAGVFLAPQLWVNNSNTNGLAFIELIQFYWDSYF